MRDDFGRSAPASASRGHSPGAELAVPDARDTKCPARRCAQIAGAHAWLGRLHTFAVAVAAALESIRDRRSGSATEARGALPSKLAGVIARVIDNVIARVHRQGSPPGFTARVHRQGSSPGFTARVHRQGSSPGFIARVHRQGSSPGFIARVHCQSHRWWPAGQDTPWSRGQRPGPDSGRRARLPAVVFWRSCALGIRRAALLTL
jgi:hypothetical protein